jgi:hypothetical protein
MIYFKNRVVQFYITFKKKIWVPNLKPINKLSIYKSVKIQLINPSNFFSIQNIWKPNLYWSEPRTNDVFLNEFKNAFVTKDGIIFKRLKAYAGSYVYSEFFKKFNNFYLLDIYKHYKLRKLEEKDNFLVIFDHWSKANYYHWMCDSLPRLMAIKKTRGEKKFKIIVPSETPSYVKDSIVKLGFIPYFFNDNEYLKILNLYHINYLSISGYAHPIINELVVELKKKIVKVEKQKYYLSRNNTIKRSISNEEELINELKKFGFKIIHTENKTLEEQIQIFSDCEILVSPHGAGMTNMLFMPKGSKIIEIGHSNLERQTLCYWHLASQLKHDYSYIPVDSDKNEIFMLDANALKLINEVLSME